ncbi:hypothetical protein [Nocardia huaxiensis]|uniref:Excreted virulence factor EspC (Type VII ESX diderm) n=1 Tax=Nocardia huaxiensis TaxID=2755382 RepID=A0A7D6Z7X4_9NOCA|nr:hypothetical protein [Nocardia huaxiensis]QLY29148.1 hypothetical protein H0264_28175 [Nocardia huaxiensis]UFS97356.1 hypothetical protein LPY97_05425 [Nocardia huaxiensis]
MFQVDPDDLRGLSSSMEAVAAALEELEVLSAAVAAGGALPGANLTELCTSAGEVTESAYRRAANRCRRIAQIAHGGAGTYEVTDDYFRSRIAALGISRP